MGDPWQWYVDIPVVSRTYLTAAFATTAACALDIVSPFSLYFNFGLIFYKGQLWRIVTNFLFFGLFSFDFLFHMYFLVRYCWNLEESARYRGKTGDFTWMILLGASAMTCMAPFINVHFLGSSLTFMMVYLYGRLHVHQRMAFLGLFQFTAPYLPWVLLVFSVLLGNPVTVDLVGIAVGHAYYFADTVLPKVAELREWRWARRSVVRAPFPLSYLNEDRDEDGGAGGGGVRIDWD